MDKLIEEGLEGQPQHLSMMAACEKLRLNLRQLWGPRQNDVFTAECVNYSRSSLIFSLTLYCRSNSERIDKASEVIGVSQVLKHAFEPILTIIISSLEASAVFMRTKALRALGQVIVEDPNILQNVCNLSTFQLLQYLFPCFLSLPSAKRETGD